MRHGHGENKALRDNIDQSYEVLLLHYSNENQSSTVSLYLSRFLEKYTHAWTLTNRDDPAS